MGLIYNTMLLNTPTITGDGAVINPDCSVVFNGTSNYVSSVYTPSFIIDGDFTWSVMLKSSFADNQMIFDQRTSNIAGIQPLYISASKRLQFHVAPSQSVEVDASAHLKSDSWNHVVVVVKNQLVYFYVNGVVLNPNGVYVQMPRQTSLPLFIGRRYKDADYNVFYYYKGTMADVRIYDHALSHEEIHQIKSKMVLHYSFNDHNTVGQVTDGSGFGMNALATSCTIATRGGITGGYCASFSKTDGNYIRLPQEAKIRVPFSYNIWAYMDDWTQYGSDNQRLLSCTESGGYNIEAPGNTLTFAFYDGTGDNGGYGNNVNTDCTLESLGTQSWHMFTFTLGDGTTRGKKATVYIDGKRIKEVSYTGIFAHNSYSHIYLGAEASVIYSGAGVPVSTCDTFFNGKVSDFRIYADVLDDDSIMNLYNCGAKVYKHGGVVEAWRIMDGDTMVSVGKGTGVSAPHVVENTYYTTNDGARFLQIFGHDVSMDEGCFTSSNVLDSYGSNRFSKLRYLNLPSVKNSSGKYEFLLRYPRAVPLPDGYERLEYIQSNSASVDTELSNTSYVYWHDIQFMDSPNRQLMGFDGNTGSYWGASSNGTFEMEGDSGMSAQQRSIVKYKYGSTLTINGTVKTSGATSTSGNYYLFGLNNNSYYCNCKLYRFTVYSADPDTGEPVSRIADCYPCRRIKDYRVGLYDIIRGRFLTSGSSAGWFGGGKVDYSLYNRWEQSHNPLNTATSSGYSSHPLNIQLLDQWDHTGLGTNANGMSLMEGQLSHSYWHGSVGHYAIYESGSSRGFPSPNGSVYDCEELYIRIDNTSFGVGAHTNGSAFHADGFSEE